MRDPPKRRPTSDDDAQDAAADAELQLRINEAVELAGGVAKAAAAIGAPQQTLRNWMGGSSKAPLVKMSRLARAAGRSLDWLATGEEHANAPRDSVVMLPRYDVTRTGEVVHIERAEWPRVAFFAGLLDQAGADIGSTIALVVDGREMEPTIREGAIVAVDRSRADLLTPGVYVLVRGGRMILMRAEPRLDGSAVLAQDSRPGERQEVAAERIAALHVVGRVMAVAFLA